MSLERGFRRILVALSVLILLAGITLDAVNIRPHATVQVTLKDGRKIDMQLHGSKEDLEEPNFLFFQLKRVLEGSGTKGQNQGATSDAVDVALDGFNVRVVHGPEYWWWTDSFWTPLALLPVLFSWIVFFVLRWIARGFSRQE